MIKAFIIGISVLVGYFTTIFFSRYISYRISASQIQSMPKQQLFNFTQSFLNGSITNSNYNQSHPVLKSLTRLIEIPYLGQFFMDQKIYELAKLQYWEAIVNQTQHIIKTPANKLNFQVWYHKALAQCSLGLIQQCQQSVKEVQLLSGNKYHRAYTASLYRYLDSIKKGAQKQPVHYIEI